ncbi:MAG: cation:proton antiporter [Bacteroidaceae bacterium]|nr:cation:proton antiporter [Bacteroidaceae bacterium]
MNEFIMHFSHLLSTPFTEPILVFGLLLFIILFVTLVFKRINLPEIIGLIIAGVIIGPYGFNILASGPAVDLLSTIGLLYIMFIVGLELDMKEFKANKNKSFLFGFFTLAIPMAMGFYVSYYLLHYQVIPSLLIACLLSTHTLLTYVVVSRMGITDNRVIPVTVGGTIITDSVVLVLLAVLLKSHNGGLDLKFILDLVISLAIFTLIVFYLIPRVAKWFFGKIENERHLNYIFVLFVVLLCSILAELGGLEPIIGAFAAGLAMNRLIPKASALMNRIEFIGNSLFIPVFLISVGMLVDVRVLFSGITTLYIGLALCVTAIASKWLAAFFIQKIFKYSIDERNLIFGLSTPRAAATLAIVHVGFKAGIFGEYILNVTIILILVTCIVASFYTQHAAKNIVLKQDNDENFIKAEDEAELEKILVPIADPSHIGQHVRLAALMRNKRSDNPIVVLRVVPNNHDAEKNIMLHRKKLKELIKQANAVDIKVDTISTIDRSVVSGIVRTSRETMSNIVIIGWPGKASYFDKMFGDKMNGLISYLDKNLFICYFEKPLISYRRMIITAPLFAEREKGFCLWVNKMSLIAKELSLSSAFVGNADTYVAIQRLLDGKSDLEFKDCAGKENVSALTSMLVRSDDILVVALAHKGYMSYTRDMERVPSMFQNTFPRHSKILIFPQQRRTQLVEGLKDQIF